MSKTFQPDSLHPYIMDARLKKATGSGGISNIPIASADTVGGIMIGGSANPITITGSGNASVRKATSELLGVVKAGDGVSIDANGAISGVAYSTTEHKTGRKWIDGKDIYSITLDVKSLMTANQNSTIDFVCDTLLTVHGYAKKSAATIQIPYVSGDGASLITVYYDNANSKLHVQCTSDFTSYNGEAYITVEYTKA